ncbi:phosphatidylserine decarboxylase protein [Rutstroemia sp. NJR-2017a BBW]|nr:phosphatidylserine decarboxylase protein [Rutstroemia sp. NJR-2017a BBW]
MKVQPQERTMLADRNTEFTHATPSPNTPDIEIGRCSFEYITKRIENKSPQAEAPESKRGLSPDEATSPSKRPRISPPRSNDKKKVSPLEYWTNELRWPKEYLNRSFVALPHLPLPHRRKRKVPFIKARNIRFCSRPRIVLCANRSWVSRIQAKPSAGPSLKPSKYFPGIRCSMMIASTRRVKWNEAKVVQDITRVIVPSAQSLAICGSKHLKPLTESPAYAVGFERNALNEDQLKRIRPFVGDFSDISLFLGTWYMYFPFLTCEVKCGAGALDVADRQNAHSMTLAVRGIVEHFRLVKREKDLHREILAFSVSHDDREVRIYGHYPVIDGKQTTCYRHLIHESVFAALGGKEEWTAYKFTKNVYDIWMPTHLKRICSVIDDLPLDLDFEVLQQTEPGESGLPQDLEIHSLCGPKI